MVMNRILSSILSFSIAGMALVGCKGDENTPTPTPTPAIPTGKVGMYWSHTWGSGPFSMEANLVSDQGDTLYFERGKYYLTNFELIKSNDSVYVEKESYRMINLADPASMILNFNQVPTGSYKAIRFMVGVDSARNMSGAQTGALDPANGMFWSWSTGYIHFKVEGKHGIARQPFAYHIGGFRRNQVAMRTVTLNANFVVEKDSVQGLLIGADLKKMFDGPNPIVVRQEPDITLPGPVAQGIADNIKQMFKFDGLR